MIYEVRWLEISYKSVYKTTRVLSMCVMEVYEQITSEFS